MIASEQLPSSWNDDLIKDPDGQYKFGSMSVLLNREKSMIFRQAYGFLDYFGDIGGLIDGLYYLISMIALPYWKFNEASYVLSKIFRAGPKQKTPMTQSSQLSLLQRDFKTLPRIPKIRFLRYFFCRRSKDRKKYHSRLK